MWDRVVLAAGAATLTWADVVDWMRDDGTWAASARRVSEGRALARAGLAAPAGDALAAEARRFRRQRRLTAGEDLTRWLAHWGISVEAWVDWLDRACRLAAGVPAPPVPSAGPAAGNHAPDDHAPGDHAPDDHAPGDHAPDDHAPDDHAAATWVDAVCSGELRRAADGLARVLGAWAERTGGAPLPAEDRWAQLRGAYDAWRAEAPSARDLERALTANAAGWLRLSLEWADFGSADAALEAVACCRDDHASLASVAARAGSDLEVATVRAEQLDTRLRTVVVWAPLGVAVRAGGDGRPGLVAVVDGRRPPSLEDPADLERARAACVEERVQASVDRWVSRRA